MNKRDVVNRVAGRTELDRRLISLIVDVTLEVVMESVIEGRKVLFPSFGSFQVRRRSSYLGANPYTGERIIIPEKAYPFFDASKGFKQLVDKNLS